MGRMQKRKGYRVERDIAVALTEAGVPTQRVPLSGAVGGGFAGDLRVGSYHAEVKARGNGGGFATIERWLGGNHLLFLKRDRAEPLVVMPMSVFVELAREPNGKVQV